VPGAVIVTANAQKKSSRPTKDPEDCTRFFILTPSSAHEGKEHVFQAGLLARGVILLTAPSHLRQQAVVSAAFVPSYSGGTARDLHPLPFAWKNMLVHSSRLWRNLSTLQTDLSRLGHSGSPAKWFINMVEAKKICSVGAEKILLISNRGFNLMPSNTFSRMQIVSGRCSAQAFEAVRSVEMGSKGRPECQAQ
jgi:hypothetical protein